MSIFKAVGMESSGPFSGALKMGSFWLPSLALFYPLELARMRLMTDVGPEPKYKGSVDFFKTVVSERNAIKEVFHGVGPYMAHNILSFFLYAGVALHISPLLAPIGTFVTYPLNTIWARMTLDAGKEVKRFNGGFEVFEHIMDKEGGARGLYHGFSVYLGRNLLIWYLGYSAFKMIGAGALTSKQQQRYGEGD